MVVTADDMAGFLSGGCIEAEVAIHARAVLADGEPKCLIYGKGSPFVDTRLPCGGRLDLLMERVAPEDPVIDGLRDAEQERRPVTLFSNGMTRGLVDGDVARPDRVRAYLPRQRLIVIGSDAFALAMADQGARQRWDIAFVRPKGPESPPPLQSPICAPPPATRWSNSLPIPGLRSP